VYRWAFLGTLAGGLLASPLAAEAQPTGRARIAILETSAPDPARVAWVDARPAALGQRLEQAEEAYHLSITPECWRRLHSLMHILDVTRRVVRS
jgi:hypothetical protein